MAENLDIWEDIAAPLVLEQYKDSQGLKDLIKVFVDGGEPFREAIERLGNFYDIEIADGEILDLLGKIRNIMRNAGESDADYRERIIQDAKVSNAGTPDYLIYKARVKSGDASPMYLEESHAAAPTAFVYTPMGRQLERTFTAKNTPAGVVGVPGALFTFTDGATMYAADGKKFLMVADDSQIGSDGPKELMTEEFDTIMTEENAILMTEGREE